MRVRTLLVALAVAVLVLGGCSDGRPADGAAPSPTSSPAAPVLGGERPARHAAPRRAMNRLERPLADQLARQIASEGLSLGYLDCPRWDGTVPSRMTCRGYVDGLVAQVEVLLKAAVRGRAVRFDAWLADGLIATRTLERTLRDHGWSRPDCGDVPVYPAHAGETLVCRVHRGSAGVARYVVATVTNRSGAVTIAGYRPGSGSL